MDDVRTLINRMLAILLVALVLFISFMYVNACGFTFTCPRGAPLVARTPIPSLVPATLPSSLKVESGKCQVGAADLVGVWVSVGSPETASFLFTDVNGKTCSATFARDIQPLFVKDNVWYPGLLSCASCHNSNVTASQSAGLDLSSYAGMRLGSRRADASKQGSDIFGSGVWEKSLLHDSLVKGEGAMALGHPPQFSEGGPMVFAGQPSSEVPTATPAPPTSTPTVTPSPQNPPTATP